MSIKRVRLDGVYEIVFTILIISSLIVSDFIGSKYFKNSDFHRSKYFLDIGIFYVKMFEKYFKSSDFLR